MKLTVLTPNIFSLVEKNKKGGFETSFTKSLHFFLESLNYQLRPCVPLTQLVELDFRELLDSTLTKVVIGYITRELYITSFVENNKFLAIITSFFDENDEFLAIITSFLTKMTSFLTKNSVYNGNNDKTCYITSLIVVFVFRELYSLLASCTCYSTQQGLTKTKVV